MADILIRGMEMPRNVRVVSIYNDGTVHDYLTGAYVGQAIELTPHGDLIDRDALPQDRVEWEDVVNAPVVIPSNKEEHTDA